MMKFISRINKKDIIILINSCLLLNFVWLVLIVRVQDVRYVYTNLLELFLSLIALVKFIVDRGNQNEKI